MEHSVSSHYVQRPRHQLISIMMLEVETDQASVLPETVVLRTEVGMEPLVVQFDV